VCLIEAVMGKFVKNGKLTLRILIDVYDSFLRDSRIERAARAAGMTSANFSILLKKYPSLRMVHDLAAERRDQSNTLVKYVLGNLSKEAREIWKDIHLTLEEDLPRTPRVMRTASLKLKKEIFLHAMVSGSYNISKACAMAGVTPVDHDSWIQADPRFKMLMGEIHQHKKDFFESKLVDLCALGHPSAIIFVNRTLNADRGYTERLQIENGSESSGNFNLAELDLDIETRKKILEAVRKQRQKSGANVVDITPPNGFKQLAENNGHEKVVDVEEVA